MALLFGTSLVGAVAVGPLGVAAHAEVIFTATSSAAATEITVSSGAIPLSTENTVGGPTAQTRLDSNGTSQAYAASPDPSGTGSRGQPLACAQAGGRVPVPLPSQGCTYPLFAATDRGQPQQTAGTPGNTVTAKSEDDLTYAAADLGQSPAASVHVTSLSKLAADGTVSSTAEAKADDLGVDGAISISGFRVLAGASRGPDGKLKTRHELSASRVTVAGQSFGLSNGTFTLPGGSSAPVPADVVFSLMKSVGVTGEFQQATQNKDGVVAPSLSLSYTVPATPTTQAVSVTVTLGRASAQVTRVAYAEPGAVVVTGSDPGAEEVPEDAGAGFPTSGSPQALLPGTSVGGSDSPVDAGVGGSPEFVTPTPPVLTAVRQPGLHDLGNIYLAVVAAALFAFGTATGVRLLGVRFT